MRARDQHIPRASAGSQPTKLTFEQPTQVAQRYFDTTLKSTVLDEPPTITVEETGLNPEKVLDNFFDQQFNVLPLLMDPVNEKLSTATII